MNPLSQHYGKAEGPLGFPMTDEGARQLEALLKVQPKEDGYDYRRAFLAKSVSELQPGERADVSWISEESVDRDREVVLASGMDDSPFKLNPLVTLGTPTGSRRPVSPFGARRSRKATCAASRPRRTTRRHRKAALTAASNTVDFFSYERPLA